MVRVPKVTCLALLGAFYALMPSAHAFAPVSCSVCPTMTEVNWKYNVSNYGTGEWELPNDQNSTGHYANYLENYRRVYANSNVVSFGYRLDYFNTEPGYDYLRAGFVSIDYGSETALDGTPSTGWRDINTSGWGSLQSIGAYFRFTTDLSVTSTGFSIGRARVCCGAPTTGAPYMQPTARYSGVLLGTGDVVYFAAPVGSTKSGDSCSSAHDTFAMWGDPTPGNDFDVVVRCGAMPTATAYTYAAASGDTQEFIHANAGADCPCGSTWYIAVYSYSGSGWFNLVQHKHYASKHSTVAQARIGCSKTAAEVDSIGAEVGRGVKHMFGAAEGTRYLERVEVRNNSSGDQLIHVNCSNGRPSAGICNGHVDMYQDWYDGETISHELGHNMNCLGDEYQDSTGTECGHSIMGSQFYQNKNYCWCTNWQNPNCNVGDHSKDTTPLGLTSNRQGPAWINLASSSPVTQTATPDNYDYTNFDFNGLMATVIKYY